MGGLKRVLESVAETKFKMGGAISATAIRALRTYRTQQYVFFVALFVVLVGIVVFGTYGLVSFLKQPNQMAVFSGAMGITVGGTIQLMRRTWKEWSQAVLLLILVEDASDAQVTALIDKLIKKL
ncbi:MAG: hypothetical protein ACRERE_34150 [Candidatus Entotheonellia bacterium]